MPSTKTLRVTLQDIVGATGGSGSTATVWAQYVTPATGLNRDIHIISTGAIVVPVRREVVAGTGPEHFDFEVIPSDDADVREEDQGFGVKVSWHVVAPEGGTTNGSRTVIVPSTADDPVQLGSLYDPPAIPAVTVQRIISGGTAETQVYDVRLRTGTSAEWAEHDPVLSLGEEGYDTDTGTRKVGDGILAWSALPASGGGGGGGTSVHGDLTGRSVAGQHPISAITDLQAALDGKATTAQGAKADTAVQPAALDAYATDAELTAGLATKAATSHAHAASDVTSGTLAVARLGSGTPAASKYVDGGTGAWTALPAAGATDHGALTGLADDDHTQYALADGTRGAFATTAQGTLAGTASQPGHAHAGTDITSGTVAAARLPAASDTASGIVELATTAETTTGTDTTRAVTAAGVKAVADTKAATSHSHAGADVTSGTVAYARLPVGTTASTVAAGDDSRIVGALQATTAQAINAQTGTSYTLVSGDAGKVVTLSNAAAITLNAPGSVFTTGQRVDVVVIGAGMATVVGTSGATANATPSLVSRAQWSAFTVLWTSATACIVIGDMA